MITLYFFLTFLGGLAGGGLIVALFLRQKSELARTQALAEAGTEHSRLTEQVRQQEEQLRTRDERLQQQEATIDRLRRELAETSERLSVQQARHDSEKQAIDEKLKLLAEAERQLADAFKALAAESLQNNNASFMTLAKATLEKYQTTAKEDLDKRQVAIDRLVNPLKESLTVFDKTLQEVEKTRRGAYEGITEQIKSLQNTQLRLQQETGNLVKALRAPQVRGQWGEMQLRRTVEIAGMLAYCDFYEQESTNTEDGRQRPDMIVRLPNGRQIVVDAKAPLAAYLEALEAPTPELQQQHLAGHARQLKDHLARLGTKNYWKQFEPSPEFVVLFLPGETFFSAALQQDPSLIEYGTTQRVILATPTTLIALLKAVAYGWRQEEIAKEAQTISDLGRDLYARMSVLAGHFATLRRGLENAVDAYNKAVTSVEGRLLPAARRFKDLHASTDKDIDPLTSIDTHPKTVSAPELIEDGETNRDTEQP